MHRLVVSCCMLMDGCSRGIEFVFLLPAALNPTRIKLEGCCRGDEAFQRHESVLQ